MQRRKHTTVVYTPFNAHHFCWKCSVGASLASPGVPLRHRLRPLLAGRSRFSMVCCSALLYCFCSFCQLFLDSSAASCKFGFSANTILNFSRFFLPFRALIVSWTSYHLPLICRLCITCGTVQLQLFFDFHHLFHQILAEISVWLIISAQLRLAPHCSAIAQQRSAVQCRALRRPAAQFRSAPQR